MSRKKLQKIATILGFGNRVRHIRGKFGQEDFGKLIGVHKSTVSRIEAEIYFPDESLLKKIAEYGGVTVEWLLHGEGVRESPDPRVKYCIRDREISPRDYDAQPLRPLETGLIAQVVAVVEQLLAERRRLKLTPQQKGRLISLLYEHCRENREPPTSHLVEKYLLLAD